MQNDIIEHIKNSFLKKVKNILNFQKKMSIPDAKFAFLRKSDVFCPKFAPKIFGLGILLTCFYALGNKYFWRGQHVCNYM